MEFVGDLTLMSFYTVVNKEKTKQFFIVQVMASWKDNQGLKNKLIDIFVEPDVYSQIAAMEIGSKVPVVHTVNYSKNQVSYSIK